MKRKHTSGIATKIPRRSLFQSILRISTIASPTSIPRMFPSHYHRTPQTTSYTCCKAESPPTGSSSNRIVVGRKCVLVIFESNGGYMPSQLNETRTFTTWIRNSPRYSCLSGRRLEAYSKVSDRPFAGPTERPACARSYQEVRKVL